MRTKEVSGYGGKYAVSDDGKVWARRRSGDMRAVKQWQWNGYPAVWLSDENGRKKVRVHRLVAEAFVAGAGPVVDHIDQDKSNNHFTNLRWTTHSVNAHNSDKARGCDYNVNARKWEAYIRIDGKKKHLGLFATEADARAAYIAAKADHIMRGDK